MRLSYLNGSLKYCVMLITGNVFKKLFSFLLNVLMVHGSAGLNLYSMRFTYRFCRISPQKFIVHSNYKRKVRKPVLNAVSQYNVRSAFSNEQYTSSNNLLTTPARSYIQFIQIYSTVQYSFRDDYLLGDRPSHSAHVRDSFLRS